MESITELFGELEVMDYTTAFYVASGFFLCENLPIAVIEGPKEDLLDYIEEWLWSPLEGKTPEEVLSIIQDAADDILYFSDEKNKPFELGPKQSQWLRFLKDKEDQRIRFKLGTVNRKGQIETASCLGSLLMFVKPDSYSSHSLNIVDQTEGRSSYMIATYSYEELGLRSPMGHFVEGASIVHHQSNGLRREYTSLVEANDQGVPWSVIARFVEQNPQYLFTKSM